MILALPSKGALAEPTLSFLRECGLRVEKPNERQYTGYISTIPNLDVLFQRVIDVVYKVADGTAQMGITGLDVVMENPHEDIIIVQPKLGYGHCSLVIALPETWIDVENIADLRQVAMDFREIHYRNLRVATKYPLLTRQFLHQHNIHHFTLVKAEGAIEAAPTLEYADIIADLTQTGTTLRENHLKMLPDGSIVDAQACLIANRAALAKSPTLMNTLRVFLEYIDASLNGRGYYQITTNICGQNPEAIARQVLENPSTQGLQGPTIAPIYGKNGHEQWFALTLIVSNKNLLPAVEHLRSIGGSQTTVTPLRYIFLEQTPTFAQVEALLQRKQDAIQ